MTRLKALIQKLSYFYIVSRQEETRFTRSKSNEKIVQNDCFLLLNLKLIKTDKTLLRIKKRD
ncbi:hypothetical protein STACA0001_2413 [Staphylococcus capitis SK14]|nr:hypothetical protein STACA0001_2413 [Staphylococcus capitis SK14]